MPNYCNYIMKVKGRSKDIQELHERLINYNHTPHFWRVFDASINSINGVKRELLDNSTWRNKPEKYHINKRKEFWNTIYNESMDDTITAIIYGYCAWSVYSCMCEGKHTYADDNPNESTSLQKTSKDLNLEIEVYSREPGVGFAEHYYYDVGETVINDKCNYNEYYYDENDDEYYITTLKKEKGIECTDGFEAFVMLYDLEDKDFIDREYAVKGGYNVPFSVI